ncbi:hypothetical protein CTM58_10375 [Prevotella intermedia]|uniref:Uncharacterized protein n=1 Tax=Prevotella intermedia TaxID=28131 RepID=A0A2M8TQC8_PREIN|nr:hypothetical protein CTM58_10375 [Prevotella intermedia]
MLSTLCKSYCFTFQKRRFCTVKAAVLQRKTYAFTMPNRNCCFSLELSLQKQACFLSSLIELLVFLEKLEFLNESMVSMVPKTQ